MSPVKYGLLFTVLEGLVVALGRILLNAGEAGAVAAIALFPVSGIILFGLVEMAVHEMLEDIKTETDDGSD